MPLDRLGRNKESGRHLFRLKTLGHQLGHALLGGCELPGGGSPSANPAQLVAGPFHPDPRAHPLEDGEGFLERLAGRSLVSSSPMHGAVGQQGTSLLERDRSLRAQLDGALELGKSAVQLATVSEQ